MEKQNGRPLLLSSDALVTLGTLQWTWVCHRCLVPLWIRLARGNPKQLGEIPCSMVLCGRLWICKPATCHYPSSGIFAPNDLPHPKAHTTVHFDLAGDTKGEHSAEASCIRRNLVISCHQGKVALIFKYPHVTLRQVKHRLIPFSLESDVFKPQLLPRVLPPKKMTLRHRAFLCTSANFQLKAWKICSLGTWSLHQFLQLERLCLLPLCLLLS